MPSGRNWNVPSSFWAEALDMRDCWNTRAASTFNSRKTNSPSSTSPPRSSDGRPTASTATQDAVVRVEVHRLRKKLREIYEKDARTEGLQISLPPGTYVPKFTPVPGPLPAPHDEAPHETGSSRRFPKWALFLSIACRRGGAHHKPLLYDGHRPCRVRRHPRRQQNPQRPRASEMTRSRNFISWRVTAAARSSTAPACDGHPIATSPPAANGRETVDPYTERAGHSCLRTGGPGEFGYDIPVAPGSYELRLFFTSAQAVGAETLSGFNVALNGKPLLDSFRRQPECQRSRRRRGAGVQGHHARRRWIRTSVVLEPTSVRRCSTPWSSLPEFPANSSRSASSRNPRLSSTTRASAGEPMTTSSAAIASTERRKVSGTEDPELFGTERFGHFSYAIPVDKRGRYTVILHFAEMYYGPQLSRRRRRRRQDFPRVLQWANAAAGFRHLQGSRQPAGRDQDFLEHQALRAREDQSQFRTRR